MADTDKSLYNLRYNQITSNIEGFGGGSPQWTLLTLNNVDPQQVPVTRQINTTTPLQGGGNLTVDRTLSILQATNIADGYLSSVDWNTFNNKQPAGNYITALTGDATATGPGSVPITLATVNGNVGTFSYASITVNGKGLITSASNGTTGSLTDVGTDGIVVTGGTGAVVGSGTSIAQHVADTTHNGYLSSTDWNIFNGKGTVAGSDTQIQFNNAGAFGASSQFEWNDSGAILKLSRTAGSQIIGFASNGTTEYGELDFNSDHSVVLAAGGEAQIISNLDSAAKIWHFTTGGTISVPLSGAIQFNDAGTHSVSLAAPASIGSSYSLLLPTAQGASNTVLKNDGSGNTAFVTVVSLIPLTSAHIFVGNGSNVPTDVALSGDATLANTGALALATVNGNVGSFTNANITVNAKGLITAASNGSAGTGTVTNVSGTTNQITVATGTTTPVISIANPVTFPGAMTAGGALAMAANKITGLANGTAATDAMAFGQNHVFQVVSATSTTQFTTTSNTFQTTNLSASITPTSTSSKIVIIAAGFLEGAASGGTDVTISRGGTNILASSGQQFSSVNAPCSVLFTDSPASISSLTYAVQIRSVTNGQTSAFGESNFTQSILLVEVQ